MLASCKDFKEEETAFKHLGRTQLGVKVKLTPKFHAELAGEGVEYSWAHSKAFYRRLPLSAKKGRENFKSLVRKSSCPINVLTKHRIKKFAGQAMAYICTYYHLEQVRRQRNANLNSEEERTAPKNQELLYSEIEQQ